MAVRSYKLNTQKNTSLSKNFTVKEFACNDGSNQVLIDSELVKILQKIRDYFEVPVTITSGYRTSNYNKKIGGSSASYHVKGKAADIQVKNVDPIKVAAYADKLLGDKGGVELGSYSEGTDGYVHIDVRTSKWRAIRSTRSPATYTSYYGNWLPTVKTGSSGRHVTVLSRKLKKLGYLKTVTNTCSNAMVTAIKDFQTEEKLTVDGIFGIKSWQKLVEKL